MVPDGNGEFTEKMGMLVDKTELGFGKRSWRYSMLVKDGVIEKMFIEPEKPGDPFEVSDADTMLNYINPKAKKPDQVAILTREGCGYCAKAKALLKEPRLRLLGSEARPQRPLARRRRHHRAAAPCRRCSSTAGTSAAWKTCSSWAKKGRLSGCSALSSSAMKSWSESARTSILPS